MIPLVKRMVQGSTNMACLNPYSRLYRYWILFLICYIEVAICFCIEMMGGLQNNFIKVFKIDAKQYNILFSAYTWPDILLSIVGAIIIDRFIGKRIGLMVIATSLVVGIMIFITGLYNNIVISHWLLVGLLWG